jgi:hypothetical protein
MALLKNVNVSPVMEILEETGIVKKREPRSKSATNKDELRDILSDRGVGLDRVATEIENQLYSSDDNIKDKAIAKLLKLYDIDTKDESGGNTVNIILQTIGGEQNLLSVVSPRD